MQNGGLRLLFLVGLLWAWPGGAGGQPVPLPDQPGPEQRQELIRRSAELDRQANQFFHSGQPDRGLVLNTRGDHAAAAPLLVEALAMRRRLYPKENFPEGLGDLSRSLNNLGACLQARGDLAGAEPLLREALTLRRQQYPREHYP